MWNTSLLSVMHMMVTSVCLSRVTKTGADTPFLRAPSCAVPSCPVLQQHVFPLHIRRNVTIKSILTSEAFASLDFRYLSGRLAWPSYRVLVRYGMALPCPSGPWTSGRAAMYGKVSAESLG